MVTLWPAALVAEAWLQDRAGSTDQAHPQGGVPWDPVEPTELQKRESQKRAEPSQLELTVDVEEPPRPTPSWVREALARKAG